MHFKLPSFRKRPPLPNGSTAQQPVDDLEDRPSFFRTNRKMIALAVIAIALVVISGLFNRGSHSTPTDVATQQSQQEQLAAQNQMISTLHNQLEAERKRSQQTADAVLAMSSAPNPASLTPQQQAALYAASQGQTNPYAVQQAGYRGGGRSNPSETQKTPDVPKAPNDTAEIITFAVPALKEPAVAAPEPGDGVKTVASSNEEKPEDTADEKKPDPRFTQATGPTYRIRRGTLLPCTQMLRINGAFASSINCIVAIPWYSTDGTHLLIPQDTLALGHTQKVSSTQQERLFVSFDQFIEPDGYTITVKDTDGMDQIGQTGLRDKVYHHYAQILGASIAVAAIGGLAQIGNFNNSSAAYSPMSQYRAGFTETMSENSIQILNRFLNILPTFVIREGARNNIYVSKDILVPDYRNHTMPGNM